MKQANRYRQNRTSSPTSFTLDHSVTNNYQNPLAQLTFDHAQVMEKIDNKTPVVIIAGHYCLADHMQELSSTGDAESQGFELGVQLLIRALKRGVQHHLVVWINDIGISRQQRENNKNTFVLPDNYQIILEHYGIDPSNVIVMFESCMRNKASTLVKRILKQQPGRLKKVDADNADLVRCVQNGGCDLKKQAQNHAYVITGPDQEQLVIKEGPAPKCNLILATFFNELVNRFYPQHVVNIFNDVYAYRLRLGVHVVNHLLNNTVGMTNVLCDGELLRCEYF